MDISLSADDFLGPLVRDSQAECDGGCSKQFSAVRLPHLSLDSVYSGSKDIEEENEVSIVQSTCLCQVLMETVAKAPFFKSGASRNQKMLHSILNMKILGQASKMHPQGPCLLDACLQIG